MTEDVKKKIEEIMPSAVAMLIIVARNAGGEYLMKHQLRAIEMLWKMGYSK